MGITISRDTSKAWPVIDGPRAGEIIASVHDDFELVVGDEVQIQTATPFIERRVRYYLCQLEGGGLGWTIKPC